MKTQILEIKTGSRPIEQIIDVVQGDSGRVLRCIISDMSIPEGSIARYYGKKPSGMQIYNDCNIDGNVVVLEITTQMTAETGILYGQIEVTNNNKTVTSFCFPIRINKNIKSSDAIESTNEFTALEKALQKAESLTDPIITFSEATERKNLISGSKLSIIIGNISKWLKDLKTAAFMDVANNDTTTIEGYVADARAVKDLGIEIDELNTKLNENYANVNTQVYLYKEGKKVIASCYQFVDITKLTIPEAFRPALTVQLSVNYYTTDWKYYPGRLGIKHDGSVEVGYFSAFGGSSTVATTGYIAFNASWYVE